MIKVFNKNVASFMFMICFFVFSIMLSTNINIANAAPDLGMQYGTQTGLSDTDPKVVIARLIQFGLGFLAIIAVVLIIYAGFLWMTASGREDQVEKAKTTLKNATIGLIIILSAFGIVTLVLNALLGMMHGSNSYSAPKQNIGSGFGVSGVCGVDSYYPASGEDNVPRNTALFVTFKEEVDLATVCATVNNGKCENSDEIGTQIIYICKDDLVSDCNTDQGIAVKISSSDKKTFIFKPVNYLGSSTGDTDYTVRLTGDIKKINGASIFENCANNFFEWSFTVNDELDFEPPQVKNIFPYPDNSKDIENIIDVEKKATGSIEILDIPNIYTPASLNQIDSNNFFNTVTPTVNITVDNNCVYNGWLEAVFSDDGTGVGAWTICKLDTQGGSCVQDLGVGSVTGMYNVNFPNILKLNFTSEPPLGSSGSMNINKVIYPDTITVSSDIYSFVSSNIPDADVKPNEIKIGTTTNKVALNISNKSFNDVNSVANGAIVNFTAYYSGKSGNNIFLTSTNNSVFSINDMSGGADGDSSFQIIPPGITTDNVDVDGYNYKEDEYMNAVPQISFTEAINPYKIDEFIKLVNVNSSIGDAGVCVEDSDCMSFKCENGQCIGDSLAGEFLISNQYKTFNFKTNNECGVNSCGEKMYCLPADSNIKVVINAAELFSCTQNSDCVTNDPYSSCDMGTGAVYPNICIDDQSDAVVDNNIPLPMANQLNLNGLTDAALNSLNGNSNFVIDSNGDPVHRNNNNEDIGYAEGNINIYEENKPDVILDNDLDPNNDSNLGDNFIWSFWVNNKIKDSVPVINKVNPVKDGVVITDSFKKPIDIEFDSLMLSSTLKTGSINIENKTGYINHKLINLWEFSGYPIGYWITQIGIDSNTDLDSYADKTIAYINHGSFSDYVTYRAQVGSGVKDIYQNCFKPSSGPACTGVNNMNPSCCNGSAVFYLDNSTGNCK